MLSSGRCTSMPCAGSCRVTAKKLELMAPVGTERMMRLLWMMHHLPKAISWRGYTNLGWSFTQEYNRGMDKLKYAMGREGHFHCNTWHLWKSKLCKKHLVGAEACITKQVSKTFFFFFLKGYLNHCDYMWKGYLIEANRYINIDMKSMPKTSVFVLQICVGNTAMLMIIFKLNCCWCVRIANSGFIFWGVTMVNKNMM